MATKKKVKKIMLASINAMPAINTLSQEEHYVKGQELIDQGHTEDPNGNRIDPDNMYRQMMPVCIMKNHDKGFRKAFAKGGQAGVANYIKRIRQIVESN